MRIAIVIILVFFMSCASSKNKATEFEINRLEKVVSSKKIEAEFIFANPLSFNNVQGIENLLPVGSTTAAINLVGNYNYLRIKNDSISMDLPYFGEQQMFSGYNSDGGIEFDGIPKKATQKYNAKKAAYILKYWLGTNTESYTLILTLFSNKKALLSVNSSNRTNIDYDGSWQELKPEETKK